MTEVEEQLLIEFEKPLVNLEGNYGLKVKPQLCSKLYRINSHKCKHCPTKDEKEAPTNKACEESHVEDPTGSEASIEILA